MDNFEDRLKQLELKEKKLKIRTKWFAVVIPLLAILGSLATTLFTTQYQLNIDRLNYTQEQINSLIKDSNIVNARNKIKFLIESDLIGNKHNKDSIINALNKNLINQFESTQLNLQGVIAFNKAIMLADMNLPYLNDSIINYYQKAIGYFYKALELNPEERETYDYLANAYYNLATIVNYNPFYKEALNIYNKELNFDPNQIVPHLYKAEAFYNLLEDDSAKKELLIVKELGIKKLDTSFFNPYKYLFDSLRINY